MACFNTGAVTLKELAVAVSICFIRNLTISSRNLATDENRLTGFAVFSLLPPDSTAVTFCFRSSLEVYKMAFKESGVCILDIG
jgi:hypothetical protein